MKNVLFAVALLITITSCTATKHVSREKDSASVQIQSIEVTASKENKQVKTDLKATIDTHTSEDCDSNFLVSGSSLHGEKSLRDMISDGSMNIESPTVDAQIHYDSVKKTISLVVNEKARLFPVRFNRTTDTREVKDQEINLDESSVGSAVKNQQSSSESEKEKVQKEVEKAFPVWIVPVGVIAAVLGFILFSYIHKRFFL